MRGHYRGFLIAAWLLAPVTPLHAQSVVDPTGHWEGSVQIPDAVMRFEVDLTKTSTGELAGTLSVPAQNLRGLPLLTIAVDGKAVGFSGRQDQRFDGVFSDDGMWIVGEFSMSGYAIPFRLNRTGDPIAEVPTKNASIGKELEGTWNATLGGAERLVLTLSNRPDGTATGSVVNLDEGGLTVPIATITQTAAGVTFEFKAIAGSYSGALAAGGTELVGTYRQGATVVPLTFQRAAAAESRR
jgi:hypothetical protein